jgi:hypothetical protein
VVLETLQIRTRISPASGYCSGMSTLSLDTAYYYDADLMGRAKLWSLWALFILLTVAVFLSSFGLTAGWTMPIDSALGRLYPWWHWGVYAGLVIIALGLAVRRKDHQ